jgi:hypothetical protein
VISQDRFCQSSLFCKISRFLVKKNLDLLIDFVGAALQEEPLPNWNVERIRAHAEASKERVASYEEGLARIFEWEQKEKDRLLQEHYQRNELASQQRAERMAIRSDVAFKEVEAELALVIPEYAEQAAALIEDL